MKKNRNNIGKSLGALLLLMAFSFVFTSCSDDDSAGGQPTITGVRVPDPAKADSLFTKSGAGQLIAIIGTNLGHAQKVYINDQEVYFNPTMNTDHSIMVTIPSEKDGFKLSAFNSNIKDEIRVETSHGTAVYAFKITAPGPQLRRIDANYPRQTGDTLRLNGLNLVDIEKMYITDLQSAQLDTTVWKEVGGKHVDITDYFNIKQNHYLNTATNAYETSTIVGAIVPAEAPDSGTLVMECAAGITYVGYYKVPGKPVISYISSDMPQIGETLIITGREFVQVESVTYGDVTLKQSDFTVSASLDTIYVDFKKKPTAGSGTTLTVKTPGGSVTSSQSFYDRTTLLTTFDGDAIDNGWGPNAIYEDSGTADGIFGHINVTNNGGNGWGTMIYWRKDWNGNSFPLSANIPSTASAKDIYLAYNVYDNNSDFNSDTFSGMIRYLIQPIGDKEYYCFIGGNGVEWSGVEKPWTFTHPVLADINDRNPKGKWYRAVVSLDNFGCFKGLTYADIVKQGINQFRLMECNEGKNKGKIDIKVDNVRVIYIPSK